MFEVWECLSATQCEQLARRFGAPYAAGDRVWVLSEGEARGIGVAGLEGARIVLRAVTDCGDPAYRDALTRSVLFVLSQLAPIPVVVRDRLDYYARFGFAATGDGQAVIDNRHIKFTCAQHAKEDHKA